MTQIERSITILIVDDGSENSNATAAALGARGYEATQAENADAALRLLRDSPRHFDILFADASASGSIDGLQLVRWTIENRPETRAFVAASALQAVHEAYALCGPNFVLPKPYSLAQIDHAFRKELDAAPPGGEPGASGNAAAPAAAEQADAGEVADGDFRGPYGFGRRSHKSDPAAVYVFRPGSARVLPVNMRDRWR